MKVTADLSECGKVNLMYAGTVNFDTEGVKDGVELCKLPSGVVVTRAVVLVKTEFDAETTNVLTIGTNESVDNIFGDSDVTAGTVGVYDVNKFLELTGGETSVKAKFTQSGTAAKAGSAEVYLFVVRIPE